MRLHNSQKTKVCPLFLVPPTKAAEAISVAVSTTAGAKIKTLDTLQGKLLKPGEDWSPFVHQIVHEFQSHADVVTSLKDTHNVGRRLNPFSLDVVETGELLAANVSPFLVMTRAELYAVFAQQWCDREVTRQLNEDEHWKKVFESERALWKFEHATRVKKVLALCKELAFLLFLEGKTQLEILNSSIQSDTQVNVSQQLSDFSARVSTMFAGNQQEWRCSPLKKSGAFFSFLHKTVQEYFTALAVCQELGELHIGQRDSQLRHLLLQGQFISPTRQKPLLLAQQLLHGDGALNTVRFCADLVDKRVQKYVSFGPTVDRTSGQFFERDPQPWADRVQPTARALWDTVQASRLDVARSNPDCAIAAANAITVLNAAGIIFDHCDLSHATLGPVVGGDERSVTKFYAGLSGAVLSHANLSHACITKASLASSCLDGADLRFASLRDVDFGQRASLLGHTSSVNSVSFSPDGKYVVSGSGDY